jgi:uncharacterized protein YndB with AHSA1/START domain
MAAIAGARPSAERALVVTRVFDAPRELVFQAWTDPRQARHWWGPKHHPAIHVEMDVRTGGRWRNCLRSTETGAELWHRGVFHEVVVPERIVFTFAWEEEGERGLETLVTVTFADEDGNTRVTLRQAPFQSGEECEGHEEGWSSTLERLAEHLARSRA